MLRVSLNLLRSLEASIDKGWFKYDELERELGGREEAFYTLLEGFSLGLYRIKGEDAFEIRREGLRLLETWSLAGRPEVDPWVDSRVYTMLYTAAAADGRVVVQDWRPILEDRGLAEGGLLTGAAQQLLDLVPRLERSFVITKLMAKALAKAPDGPARAEDYGKWLPVYEAMGLVVGTVPLNPFYSLTAAGRFLKRAMLRANLDVPYPSIVNPRVLDALERAERGLPLGEEEKVALGVMGFLKATGELDYPGRLVLAAYRGVRSMERRRIAPMALSPHEERLVKAVVETWRDKVEGRRPNILVDKEWIARKYRELWGENPPGDLSLDLLHLESLGLVREVEEEGKQVYEPTREGEIIAGLPGVGKGAPVLAVKSITSPMSYESPAIEWVSLGMDHGVVAKGGPTRRGEMLARASQAARSPLVTRVEAAALQRIPEGRSVERRLLEDAVRGAGGDPVEALDRLEARGLIETLPDGRIRLTYAGRLVKTALIAVPPGIAVPISPVIIRVLKAVSDYGTEDIATLVNKTRLSLGTVKEALTIARAAKFLGKGGGLTAAGKALLEALAALSVEEEKLY